MAHSTTGPSPSLCGDRSQFCSTFGQEAMCSGKVNLPLTQRMDLEFPGSCGDSLPLGQ